VSFDSIIYFAAGTMLPSFIVAWLATFAMRRLAPRWGLVDRPRSPAVHAAATPLGGGLAIWLGVFVYLVAAELLVLLARAGVVPDGPASDFAREHLSILLAQSGNAWTLFTAATALLILGLIDDRHGLGWRLRLGVQFCVAAASVAAYEWLSVGPHLPFAVSVLSTVWIVGLINSFNMLDNMDGLSGGVAAVAAAALAIVLLLTSDSAAHRPQILAAGFLLAMIGALIGFLLHNWPPALIFMGDAGSYFIGFLIAVSTLLSLQSNRDSGSAHANLAPVLAVSVPLYDMLTVVWIRLRAGRSPFQPDKSHFSHRLVDLGLTKPHAVFVILLITAICGLGSALLYRVDAIGAGIIVISIISMFILIAILETTLLANKRKQIDGSKCV